MRKIILGIVFLSLTVAFSVKSNAQERFKAGVVAGVNLNQVDGDALIGFHQLGFQGGLKVYTIFTERWEMGMSILYTQHGSKAASTDYASSYDKLNFNFVEVPVLIHFNEWKFQLGSGFSFARLINYKTIDLAGLDISDLQDYNSNIFSFIVETSLKVNEHLNLNVRWSKSLNNLQANSDNGKFFSRVIGLRAIYIL